MEVENSRLVGFHQGNAGKALNHVLENDASMSAFLPHYSRTLREAVQTDAHTHRGLPAKESSINSTTGQEGRLELGTHRMREECLMEKDQKKTNKKKLYVCFSSLH